MYTLRDDIDLKTIIGYNKPKKKYLDGNEIKTLKPKHYMINNDFIFVLDSTSLIDINQRDNKFFELYRDTAQKLKISLSRWLGLGACKYNDANIFCIGLNIDQLYTLDMYFKNKTQSTVSPIEIGISQDEWPEIIQGFKNCVISSSYVPSRPAEQNYFFITPSRTQLFEIFYKVSKGEIIKYKSIDENILTFFDKLESTKSYNKEFFIENDLSPKTIIFKEGKIDIPILEKINQDWIFYKHNYDKYREEIIERNKK